MTTNYRIYLDHKVQGPYNLDELMKLENLSKETLVCEVGDLEWESVGNCQSIQQQLAMQPLKWGAIQRVVLNISATLPQNQKSMRTVSNSGDFEQRERWRNPPTGRPRPKPAPAHKRNLFSKIATLLHGGNQK
jgi:hypothetical protein